MTGRYLSSLSRSRWGAMYYRIVGNEDPHTQTRLRPLLKFLLKNKLHFKRVMEPGCGSGDVLLELKTRGLIDEGDGYDLNESSIKKAQEFSSRLGYIDSLHFHVEDLTKPFSYKGKYDALLLIDFLEHIHHPELFLRHIKNALKPDSYIFISVPTPLYPKVFGKKFHAEVGHLVEGYMLSDMDQLFSGIASCVFYQYNTGLLVAPLMALYYRALRKLNSRVTNKMFALGISPFLKADIFNRPGLSSGLFAVYHYC